MTTAIVDPGFADDPVATHSAQFPLGGSNDAPGHDRPSPAGIRPWNLRGMQETHADRPSLGAPVYDPISQTSAHPDGTPLLAGPTANSVSDNDGDEGKSEDWTYDFAPDNPYRH